MHFEDDDVIKSYKVYLQTKGFSSPQSSPTRENDKSVVGLTKSLEKKSSYLNAFLRKNNHRLECCANEFRKFAYTPGGLISDQNRELIWPVLAANLDDGRTETQNCMRDHVSCSDTFDQEEDFSSLRQHKDWHQVELDVRRGLNCMSSGETDTKALLTFTAFIVKILVPNKNFNYYQGFHSVCIMIILTVGFPKAFYICRKLSTKGMFCSILLKSFEESTIKDLKLMFPLIKKESGKIDKVFKNTSMGCLFALPWPITWFSHSLHYYQDMVVCFDFLLASHPLMPIYLCATLVISREEEIVECEQDMAALHGLLNKIPPNLLIPPLIQSAQRLFYHYPPAILKGKLSKDYYKQKKSNPFKITKINIALKLLRTIIYGFSKFISSYLLSIKNDYIIYKEKKD
uniref:Rab-GAP TBC domain-containing protein n=1 Tax=Rhabditophanes sp. KR3021 TaxID=114890 RepID=A0AC35TYZ1_9BILA